MNANELADYMDDLWLEECRQAATMLRQQQAEIEALEAEIEALKRKWLDACDGIIEVKQRYEKAQEK